MDIFLWLGVGRRAEYAITVLCALGFLGLGFSLTRNTFGETYWILWTVALFFTIPYFVAGIVLLRLLRKAKQRRPENRGSTAARNRVIWYLGFAGFTIVADTTIASKLGKQLSLHDLFLWDVVVLAALIAMSEFIAHRQRDSANPRRRPE